MDKLVSVIVPVYNTAPYLERCVKSVLSQTWENLELLLINDGSTDNSGSLCDAFAREDDRVRVLHKPNGGVSSARNLGLESMKGAYFLFLDSDDSLDCDAIRTCMDAADGVDAVVFGCRELRAGSTVNTGIYQPEVLTDMPGMVRKILAQRHIYGGGYPNKLWRTAAFGQIPMFSTELCYVEDMEWVIRMLLLAKRIRVIEPAFYNYHLRDDSVSHSDAISEKRLIGYHDTLAKMVEDLVRYPEMQQWFNGIRWTELINSIIDAKIKKQTKVYKALYQKLRGNTAILLKSEMLSVKIKLRLLVVTALHGIGLI